MNLENFFGDAMQQPPSYIAYSVSSELAKRFPGRSILEGEDSDFNLTAFVRDGRCAVVNEPAVHAQAQARWDGFKKSIDLVARNGWLNVLWQGHLLDVVVLTWESGGCETTFHWVVADDAEIASAFYRSVCEWNTEVRGEILVFEHGQWRKDERLFEAIKGATFESLVLPEPLGSEVREDLSRFLASRELYERYGVPWKRGVLLTGPPGNGKTHAVKALANSLGVPVLYVRSFVSKYGTVQGNMRAVFERARGTTPCLLVLEDLDSLIDDSNRSYFLNELDGFASNTGVVVIATTNHPEKLDTAILDRPSRFDRKYDFPLPASPEREAYVRRWNGTLQEEVRLTELGVAAVVALTDGYSFAYLKELFLSSLMVWVQSPAPGRMDAVMGERAGLLREQIRRDPSPTPTEAELKSDEEE